MLDFQLSTVIFTVLNLLILYVVLKKLLFGRVNRILEERAALVEQELSSAERQKVQAEELRKEYEDQLSQADRRVVGRGYRFPLHNENKS